MGKVSWWVYVGLGAIVALLASGGDDSPRTEEPQGDSVNQDRRKPRTRTIERVYVRRRKPKPKPKAEEEKIVEPEAAPLPPAEPEITEGGEQQQTEEQHADDA